MLKESQEGKTFLFPSCDGSVPSDGAGINGFWIVVS